MVLTARITALLFLAGIMLLIATVILYARVGLIAAVMVPVLIAALYLVGGKLETASLVRHGEEALRELDDEQAEAAEEVFREDEIPV